MYTVSKKTNMWKKSIKDYKHKKIPLLTQGDLTYRSLNDEKST